MEVEKNKLMRIVYPYPMHISNGYTYMLSIAQFVNALSKFCKVDLLSLDSEHQLRNFYASVLGKELSDNLTIIQTLNRKFGIKSNRIFFQHFVRDHVQNILNNDESVIIYSRDYKQISGSISAWKGFSEVTTAFESHQILSQNYCRLGQFRKAEHFRKIERKVLEHVDLLFPITSTLSDDIDRTFNDVTNNRAVLPVGVLDTFFDLPIVEKEYDLVYCGTFSSWKGIHTLAKAISIAHNKYRDLRVLFLGISEDQKSQVMQYMSESGLDFRIIHFHERIPHKEIPSLLQKAKIGMVSVSYEDDGLLYTSPLKLYEYLASGLAVIAPRTPPILSAIPETLIHWAVTDDPQSYADAIARALNVEDDNRRERIEFARKFTWDERAKRLVSFLNDYLQIHK